MKKNPAARIVLPIVTTFIAVTDCLAQDLPDKEKIGEVMVRVGDYQIARPWPLHLLEVNPYATGPKSWVAGSFYPGVVELYKVTGDPKYIDLLIEVGEGNDWESGPRLRAADDQAILQTYLDLYDMEPRGEMLLGAKKMIETTMASPAPGSEEWHWSDALFMSPPVWAHYAAITEDKDCFDFMDNMWWDAVGQLFSEEHRLFYRDSRFKTIQSGSGRPVFWSRGNGWVAASLPRIMKYIPENHHSRHRYETLLKTLASRLKDLQCPDGFWKASLMDPWEFPFGESSGTGMFCYMISWGINEGLLDRYDYLEVALGAWNALVSCVHTDGKLGFAQGGGDRPFPAAIDNCEPFAAGAFLMAGSEIIRLGCGQGNDTTSLRTE